MRTAQDEIGDDEWITQKISRSRPDINSPRPQDLGRPSAIRGRCSVERAYQLVVKGGRADEDDGVRYAKAGELRDAGFRIIPTPTVRNRNHVSISMEGDWGDTAARKFMECFSERVWFGEDGEVKPDE